MANCVLYCVNLIKMPFEWLVGLRYTRAGRRNGRNSFISFISAISMAGIALGVTALIVVLSVYNGFQTVVTERMVSVLGHVELYDVGSGGLRRSLNCKECWCTAATSCVLPSCAASCRAKNRRSPTSASR
jgi:ABC-type lipoprotein release transport system permease subunit